MNFFAVLRGAERSVARIPLERRLQDQLTELFRRQEAELLASDLDEVKFDPAHNPDDSEIACIEGVELPEAFVKCATAPLERETLSFSVEVSHRICGVLGAEKQKGDLRLLIQGFDQRRVLDNSGFSLLLSGETFRRLSDPGLVLDKRLVAVFKRGNLYFRSFFMARRVLDLSDYYREATDSDLMAFAKHSRVSLETPTTLSDNADNWVRRRIATLRDSQLMKNVSPRKIAAEAKSYGLDVGMSQKLLT